MIPFLGPADPFPPVEQALDQPDGLLAAGGSLTTRRLVDAYRRGIFPWFNEGDPILWWSPDPRTVLRPSRIHVSHSLRKTLRKESFLLTIDRVFTRVLDGCAAPRPGDPSTGSGSSRAESRDDSHTWLSLPMRRAYASLHAAGLAHSIEVWMDGELAGGIYGVAIGRMFFGESMFSRRTDASKIAMARLAAQLDRWGFPLIDCQLETHHLVSLGAEPLSRRAFIAEVTRLTGLAGPKWAIDADLAGSVEHAPRILKQGSGIGDRGSGE
jgi:leucyl/phenylalanyl-tRNA--protein transferase